MGSYCSSGGKIARGTQVYFGEGLMAEVVKGDDGNRLVSSLGGNF